MTIRKIAFKLRIQFAYISVAVYAPGLSRELSNAVCRLYSRLYTAVFVYLPSKSQQTAATGDKCACIENIVLKELVYWLVSNFCLFWRARLIVFLGFVWPTRLNSGSIQFFSSFRSSLVLRPRSQCRVSPELAFLKVFDLFNF